MTHTPGTSVCTVPRCDHPTHDQHTVCGSCLTGMRRDLRELPELLPDLDLTLTRQNVSGVAGTPEPPEEARTKDGPSCATTVLPFRPMASDVGRYLHATLDHWTAQLLAVLGLTAAEVFEHRPPEAPYGPLRPPIPAQRTTGRLAPVRWAPRAPARHTLELAAWLDRHPDTIATHPEAGALVENVRWAVEDVRRVIFPRQMQFVGPCVPECGAALYAPVGVKIVRCRECDRGWRVDELTSWYQAQAEGMLLPAEDMSRALPRLAANIEHPPLTASQIRGYGRRGRLAEYRPDPRTWSVGPGGEPVPPPARYKVGDVITLMKLLMREEEARQERRAAATSSATRARIAASRARLQEALSGRRKELAWTSR